MRRASGLSAATLLGAVILLGGGGTALADTVPTAANTPYYVRQPNPPQPGGYDAGIEAGLNLGKQTADTDFKHGQMSRAFPTHPTVPGNDPSYAYQLGVLRGTSDGYTTEIAKLLREKAGWSVSPAPDDEAPSNQTPSGHAPSNRTPSGHTPSSQTNSGTPSCGSCASTTSPSDQAPSGQAPSGQAPSSQTPSSQTPSGP